MEMVCRGRWRVVGWDVLCRMGNCVEEVGSVSDILSGRGGLMWEVA